MAKQMIDIKGYWMVKPNVVLENDLEKKASEYDERYRFDGRAFVDENGKILGVVRNFLFEHEPYLVVGGLNVNEKGEEVIVLNKISNHGLPPTIYEGVKNQFGGYAGNYSIYDDYLFPNNGTCLINTDESKDMTSEAELNMEIRAFVDQIPLEIRDLIYKLKEDPEHLKTMPVFEEGKVI